MVRPKRHLLYLVHGAVSYYHEAAYSILSLWRQPGTADIGIVVVTNDPAPLQALIGEPPQVRYLVFSPEQRREWQGSIDYIHRMKPCAFAWAIDTLSGDGDPVWAFIDSDTAFTAAPDRWLEQVAQGTVVLHAQEGTVHGNRTHSRSQRRLDDACRRQMLTIRGKAKQVSGDSAMWNSGVIGLRASQRSILTETVALIDTLFPICPIHTVEQVALSLVLQDRAQLVATCDGDVLHYHIFKEFRDDLARFFEHYRGALLPRLLQAWPEVDPALRIVPKREFNALPKWRRKLRRYLGDGWKPLPLPW
ncbi:MAG TPA: hypothetical protein VN230_09200 [Burkholderiaceae bacterium]|nr:hypothetical protein [Burkholderiaceae bacterium]